MNEGERVLHDAIVRGIASLGEVGSLRRLAEAGLEASTATLAAQSAKLMEFLTRKEELANALGVPVDDSREAFVAALGQRNADETARRALLMVRAAELVLYHSLCDDVVTDCCRAVTLLVPRRCEGFVRDDSVDLRDVRDKSYDVLLAESLKTFAGRLANRSLPNRIQWLFKMCPPRQALEVMPDYRYDGAMMQRMDDRRHDVIHGQGVMAARDVGNSEMTFMQQTFVFMPHHVSEALGIMIDTTYTATALRARL